MNLLLFEVKKIILNKIYMFFCLIFMSFMILMVNPISYFKNVAPMDEKHILALQIVKDSQKNQLENIFIDFIIDELNNSLLSAKIDDDTDLIKEIESKIELLNDNKIVYMNAEKKKALVEISNYIVERIDNGNLSYTDIINMDTALFQKYNIDISEETFDSLLDKLDNILGGYTYYSDYFFMDHSDFRRDLVELNGYNNYASSVIGVNDIEMDELLEYYYSEVNGYGYCSLFTFYLIDKIEIIICLLLPLVMLIYNNSNKKGVKDLIYIKKITSFKVIILSFFGIIVSVIIPILLILVLYTFSLNICALEIGYTLDCFGLLLNGLVVVFPEIIFMTALDILIIFFTDSFIPTILVSSLVFGISVDDYIGRYEFNRVIIRFNYIGNVRFIDNDLSKIVDNRLAVMFVGFVIILIVVAVYSLGRNSIFTCNNRYKSIQYKIRSIINISCLKMKLNKKNKYKSRNIFVYQYKIEYKYCIFLGFLFSGLVYILFIGDMEAPMIIRRFYPVTVLIIFLVYNRRKTLYSAYEIIELKKRKYYNIWNLGFLLLLSLMFLIMYSLVYRVNIFSYEIYFLIMSFIGVLLYFLGKYIPVKILTLITTFLYSIYLLKIA